MLRMRRIIGVAVATSMAMWSVSPSFAAPTSFFLKHHPHHHHMLGGGHGSNPWPAFYIIGGAASVILDAAIVWNSQCRELTRQEAMASFFLPVGGFLFDTYDNKCKRR